GIDGAGGPGDVPGEERGSGARVHRTAGSATGESRRNLALLSVRSPVPTNSPRGLISSSPRMPIASWRLSPSASEGGGVRRALVVPVASAPRPVVAALA